MLHKVIKIFLNSVKYYCVAHCISEHILDVVVCSGNSMEPSIKSGDIVIVQRFSTFFNDINKGDIVMTKSPINYKQFVIKRVRAMDGQTIRKGTKYLMIPKGSVWLEGDNQKNSIDSWDYGPVPKGLINGRVLYKIWPMYNFSTI
ncbi:mitochondrial inner membrane protease subunit 1-like [Daktulosphaira vitifoliae]|uniref:mitochondrial inner membrane protease subunit 1-like n=1 Tax=Daktulosphaira vitifoliae TaxID=58002 RepID=UPI0021AAAA46|nr:mitochondrial inner membrane protease subunit 1-like [Daktulosphaira vitifoliae]